jgi:hypothetical protein
MSTNNANTINPDTLISDDQFIAICAKQYNHESITPEEWNGALDYVSYYANAGNLDKQDIAASSPALTVQAAVRLSVAWKKTVEKAKLIWAHLVAFVKSLVAPFRKAFAKESVYVERLNKTVAVPMAWVAAEGTVQA